MSKLSGGTDGQLACWKVNQPCNQCQSQLLPPLLCTPLGLQETGICRPDCPFVHNVNSLQLPLEQIQQKLVAALSKGPGTRLSAAALRAAETGGGAGAGSAAAAAGGGGGQAGEWDFAQPAAQASSSKNSRGDGASITSSGPASAAASAAAGSASASARRASGPASDSGGRAPAATARPHKQSAAARHEARLAGLLGARGRPRELNLCQ